VDSNKTKHYEQNFVFLAKNKRKGEKSFVNIQTPDPSVQRLLILSTGHGCIYNFLICKHLCTNLKFEIQFSLPILHHTQHQPNIQVTSSNQKIKLLSFQQHDPFPQLDSRKTCIFYFSLVLFVQNA